VLEPDGTPSVGARVFARTRGSGAGAQGAISDESGRFSFPAARADLPATFDVEADNGGRSGTVSVPQGVADITVRLSPAASLTGHLMAGSGAAFTVTLGGQGFGFGANTMRFVGDSFRLDDLSAGQITLHVETDDQRSGDASATLVPGGTADVAIQLRGATVVSGRVIDSAGAPVTQGMVSESAQMAAIGADGRFQLRGLAPGAHQLTIRAGPGRQRTLDVTLTDGQLLELGDVQVTAQVASGTIGVGLAGRAPGLFISWTVPGGPADTAGILAGDVLSAVEGVAVADTTGAAAAITGAPGTFVHLSMARNGTPREVSVQRAR
jgi:hypothetical protein